MWLEKKLFFVWLVFLLTQLVDSSRAVGCFICNSINGSNTGCHDPFHPDDPGNYYQASCKQGKRDIKGLFPAKYCVKISGTRLRDDIYLVIRRCTVNKMSKKDRKIGQFKWEGSLYTGVIDHCRTDGCNSTPRVNRIHTGMLTFVSMLTMLLLWQR